MAFISKFSVLWLLLCRQNHAFSCCILRRWCTILYLLCVEFSWSHLRYISPPSLCLFPVFTQHDDECVISSCFVLFGVFFFVLFSNPLRPPRSFFNPVPLHVDLPPGTLCPRNSGFFCTAFWDAPRAEDSHESGPSQLVQNGHRQQETVPEPQEELADWISLPPGLPLWFRTLTGLNTHRKAGVCWSRHTFHRAAHFMIFMNSLHFFDSFF